MNQLQLDRIVNQLSQLSTKDIKRIIRALELELLAKSIK
jgi:hypothetical protein